MKRVAICPNCGSLNLSHELIGGSIPKNKCLKCEHEGISFPEIAEEDVEEFRKNLGK